MRNKVLVLILAIIPILFFFYTIPASAQPAQDPLTLGVPVSGTLSGTGDFKYYQVIVSAGERLTVVLDGEDPNSRNLFDLYIKFGSLPTTSDYDDKGDSPNADQAVEIPSTQAGIYYVMVRSTSYGGNFSIVAHNSSTFPSLTLGTAQTGSLPYTFGINYYQISVSAGQRLTVILDVDDPNSRNIFSLYIKFGSLPTITVYDDKGDSPNADQAVEIPTTQAGIYYLMVRSTAYWGSYSIVAHNSSTFPSLTLGTAQTGSLPYTFGINYYQVVVSAGERLTVVLDVEDPYSRNLFSLYIKFGSLPTITVYDDKGDSPNADQAVEIPSTQAGVYYIMVRSTAYWGSYSIVAHNSSTFPTLAMGTAQTGSLPYTFGVNYFQVSVSAGQRLTVILDVDDPNSRNIFSLFIKFGSLPTITVYDDKGDSPNADQAVEIPSTQAGIYYVMVRSTAYWGSYSIVAHNSATFPTLAVGTAQTGSLPNTFGINYYQVSVSAGERLTVILDVDDPNSRNIFSLFIRFGALPTMTDYDDKGDSPNADQAVEIPSTQAGIYYVMVRSTAYWGSYSIVAHNSATFPTLAMGTAKTGSLPYTFGINYYQVSVSAGERLTVILDVDDPNSRNIFSLYIKFGSLPAITDYDDKGDSPNADQAVEIPTTQGGIYYVMVRSTAYWGNYSLVAHNSSTFPSLILGTAKTGSLPYTFGINYYQVAVSAGERLTVVLDVEDPNSRNLFSLYIKFGSLPTVTDYDDKGDSPNADQAVEIPTTQAGIYYLMVRSTAYWGSYSIVAHNSSTFPTLTPGTAKTGSLPYTFGINYYQVSVSAGQRLMVILDGDDPYSRNLFTLFIRFGSLPTITIYNDKGDLPGADQTVEIPSTQAGTYYIMVRSTAYWGNYTIKAQAIQPIPLVLDQPLTGTVGQFSYKDYYLDAAAGLPLVVSVTPQTGCNTLWVYSRLGNPPSWTRYDQRLQALTVKGIYELPVVTSQAGRYFFSVYGQDVAVSGCTFQIVVKSVVRQLTDVSPRSAGNAGESTITLSGLPFTSGMQVELRSAGPVTFTASRVDLASTTSLLAHFDLNGAATGLYDVVAIWPGGAAASLSGTFKIIPGIIAQLETSLEAPNLVRPNRNYTLWLNYKNIGNSDMMAPLFIISSTLSIPMRLSTQEPFEVGSPQILGVASSGLAGILPAGASGRIPIYIHVPTGFSPGARLQFDLAVMDPSPQPVDWQAIEAEIRPPDVNAEVWTRLWPILTAQIGATWKDYLQTMADDASYLSTLGLRVYSVRDLFRFEVRKSLGMNPRPVLAGRQDANAPAPGLPLQFSLVFPGSLEGRFYLGPLGGGWSHSYDIFLEEHSTGDVLIHWPGSFTRQFTSNGNGTYTPLPGDYGSLTRLGAIFTLTDKDGFVYRFRSDYKLDSLEDLNGNRITLNYNGSGQLVVIQHSGGGRFTLQYNPQGRISRLTDQAGLVTQYAYDASGEHLLTVTAPGNRLTSYAYNIPAGQAGDHALTTVTYPDGLHQYFTYDSQGRLSAEYKDGNDEQITYAYDPLGRITVTDANGATALLSPDEYGRPARGEDALGRELGIEYGADFNLASLTDPAGQSYLFNYDLWGNVIGAEDPLGHRVTLGYDTRFNQISSLVDGRGNRSTFAYDSAGNLVVLAYPDASQELVTYDSDGNPLTFTSRSGDAIAYTYNPQGQLLRKDYPNGAWVTYAYDLAGNLTTATDASGSISMVYDPNTNLLTKITYPSGHWFTFSYDQAGRRTQRLGEDGYTLNYHYDSAGRLERLTDGSNLELIHYEYDSAGRLSRETKGNGTYTSYTYDAGGQLTSLVNCAPNASVQSRFDYTYDLNGNRTSMTTLAGTTAYEYDLIGQLTGVTYPGGRQVTYAYDAAGNRITVSDNGTQTAYTTNNLNQYTQVGSEAYTYDPNGNMTSKTDLSGTTTYTYDYENRLVSVAEPDGDTWQYTYDALGNRVGVNHNGIETHYTHDPIGLVDLAAEYDSGGALAARYIHGLGLVSRLDSAGDPAYYAFDAIGNTRQMSNAAGTVANTYDYDPFGIPLQTSETIPNPFRYVGQWGVMEEGNGLNFMRARYYQSDIGGFISEDPIPTVDGKPRVYAENNPLSFVDPTGNYSIRAFLWDLVKKISFGGFGRDAIGIAGKANRVVSLGLTAMETVANLHASGVVASEEIANAARVPRVLKRYPFMGMGNPEVREMLRMEEQAQNQATVIQIDTPIPPSIQSDTASSTIVAAVDPNEKVGPAGTGAQRQVLASDELSYDIYFENVATASAPAQEVVVTDFLDPDLDWTSFRLTEITWGDQTIAIPENSAEYSTRLTVADYRPGVKKSWWVDVTVEVSALTGRVRWTLLCLDPDTGLPPEDPLAGFLPPNDSTGRGEGHVSFTVRPKINAPNGTVLTNKASIVFDANQAIETNLVTNVVSTNRVYLPFLSK